MKAANFYTQPGFERAGSRRREAEWIRARMVDRESLFVPVWRSQSLVVETDNGEPQAVVLSAETATMLLGPGDGGIDDPLALGEIVFLGLIDDHAHFALDLGVDYLALSFVRKAGDVEELKKLIAAAGHVTPVIAKIERPEALEVIDEVIESSDGLMVARGDLGVELAPEAVPIAQRALVRRARLKSKPVIVATQMLESMVEHPRPTRVRGRDGRARLPHQGAAVPHGVRLRRPTLVDHATDEPLVLRLHLPAERLGPPVGELVRGGAVDGHLEVGRHGGSVGPATDRSPAHRGRRPR